MAQGKKPQTRFLYQRKKVGCVSSTVYISFFSCLSQLSSLFFFFFKFSFSFLPLDGSDGARATQRRLGQELIMNNKRVDTKEISDIFLLFTFLGAITYIASDSDRGKASRWSFSTF